MPRHPASRESKIYFVVAWSSREASRSAAGDDALQRLAVDLGGAALRGNLRVLRRVFKL